jgi:hypothetical protein
MEQVASGRTSGLTETEFLNIRDSFRAAMSVLGFQSAKVAAAELFEIGENAFEETIALNWVRRHPVALAKEPHIIAAALKLLSAKQGPVLSVLAAENPDLASKLKSILAKHDRETGRDTREGPAVAPRQHYVETMFENWKKPYHEGADILMPGVYQIFRRYKPTKPPASISGAKKADYDWSKVANHAVICELLYFDSINMEAVLITSDRNKYFGSLFIDHNKVLFCVFQRRSANRDGIHHRFLAAALNNHRYPFYSAIMLKVGETSDRPVASDCLIVMVPKEKHASLYEEFEKERVTAGQAPKDSIISEYLTSNPPLDRSDPIWSRVRRLRDFPTLNLLARPAKEHLPIFREPLRTLQFLTIEHLASKRGISIGVFTQKTIPPRDWLVQSKSKRRISQRSSKRRERTSKR